MLYEKSEILFLEPFGHNRYCPRICEGHCASFMKFHRNVSKFSTGFIAQCSNYFLKIKKDDVESNSEPRKRLPDPPPTQNNQVHSRDMIYFLFEV